MIEYLERNKLGTARKISCKSEFFLQVRRSFISKKIALITFKLWFAENFES